MPSIASKYKDLFPVKKQVEEGCNYQEWGDMGDAHSYGFDQGYNQAISEFMSVLESLEAVDEINEYSLYNFLLSLGGDLQFAYIYRGQEGKDPARDVARAIVARFGAQGKVDREKYCDCTDKCMCNWPKVPSIEELYKEWQNFSFNDYKEMRLKLGTPAKEGR